MTLCVSQSPSAIVDTHVHFWNPAELNYGWLGPGHPLHRPFLPADLELARQECLVMDCGVVGGVYVQASHDPCENAWALALACQTGWIQGVVGWLDLTADTLDFPRHAGEIHPFFKGVRHLTHDIPEQRWLRRAEVGRSLERLAEFGLSADLVLRADQLGDVAFVARQHPHLSFILNHLGNPPLDNDLGTWKADLSAVAQWCNVSVKLSGLLTHFAGAINPHKLLDAVRHGLLCFGPDRVMVGSDWPVCTLKASYQGTWHQLLQAVAAFSAPQDWPLDWQNRLRQANAQRIYRLQPAPQPPGLEKTP